MREEIGRDLDRERADAAHWDSVENAMYYGNGGGNEFDTDPEPERHETIDFVFERGFIHKPYCQLIPGHEAYTACDWLDDSKPTCKWKNCNLEADKDGYCDVHLGTL